MILFFGGLALLVVGYFTYGRLVESIVGPPLPVAVSCGAAVALAFAAYVLMRTRV